MTDMVNVDAAHVAAETEVSREIAAQAAPDSPNRREAPPARKGGGGAMASPRHPHPKDPKPLERITAADRSRADIAARFKEKRAAAGGQVEFHGDMRDPSQTYGPFAPQPDDGTASPPLTLPLVGRVGAEAAGGGGDVIPGPIATPTP